MSCSNSGQVPIDEDNNYSQNEIELNKIIGQVQTRMSLLCLFCIGLSFLSSIVHDFFDHYNITHLVSFGIILAAMLKLSDRYNLKNKLNTVTFNLLGKRDLLYIILTEITIGKIVYFGLKSLSCTLVGQQLTGLRLLSIYLLVFSVYHNGEFFFVLWCHTNEIGWKSKYLVKFFL